MHMYEEHKKNPKVKFRFRALVRKLITLMDFTVHVDKFTDTYKRLRFLTEDRTSGNFLSIEDKLSALAPSNKRTKEDLDRLVRFINKVKYFQKFPQKTIQELARRVVFMVLPKGKELIREGTSVYESFCMYILTKGSCSLTKRQYDSVRNEWYIESFSNKIELDVIGELGLMLKQTRDKSVTAMTYCEFLLIDADTYYDLLGEIALRYWNEMLDIISTFEYFKEWDFPRKQSCAMLAKFFFYEPNEVIFSEQEGLKQFVYFVADGEAYMVEQMFIQSVTKNKKQTYKLLKPSKKGYQGSTFSDLTDNVKTGAKLTATIDSSESLKKNNEESLSITSLLNNPTVRVHFFKVCEFSKFACFNIGEPLERRTIVAKSRASCICVPRFWLTKMNKGNLWGKIRLYATKHIPSSEEIFKDYMQEMKWTNYKKEVTKEALTRVRRISHTTQTGYVPYSIRIAPFCYSTKLFRK